MFVVWQGKMKKRFIVDLQAQRRVTAVHSTQRWGTRDSSGVFVCKRTKRSIVQVYAQTPRLIYSCTSDSKDSLELLIDVFIAPLLG